MRLRWSPLAAADVEAIVEYIRKENYGGALRVGRAILQNIGQLEKFPNSGRPGRVDGTRELPLAPLPFVVVYRVKEDSIEIVRVLHGAQRWP
jgi:toxin ParE1/3/4